MNSKVYLFAIGKMENKYIREWVEHYKSIGVDRIILGDNNCEDGERFDEVILDYMMSGYVTVEDYRGKTTDSAKCNLQSHFYRYAFKKYGKECEWICVLDCDELLVIPEDIHDFLARSCFKEYEQVRLYWKNYTDNGLVKANGDYRMRDRFTEWKPSLLGKSIFRSSSVKDPMTINGHGCGELKSCDARGMLLGKTEKWSQLGYEPDYSIAWVDHYRCKTIEEFIQFKINRGYADRTDEFNKKFFTINRFFFFENEVTDEKLKFAASLGYFLSDEE